MANWKEWQKAYEKELEEKGKSNAYKMGDLQGRFIIITSIEKVGESSFAKPNGEKDPSLLVNVEYQEGTEMLSGLMWVNGLMAKQLLLYMKDDGDWEAPSGILDKVPFPGGTGTRWTLIDPEERQKELQKAQSAIVDMRKGKTPVGAK